MTTHFLESPDKTVNQLVRTSQVKFNNVATKQKPNTNLHWVAYCLAHKVTSSNSIQINSYLLSFGYLLPRRVDKIRKVKRHIQREQAIGVHYFLIPTKFNRQIGTPINLSQTVRIQSQSAPYQAKKLNHTNQVIKATY